MSSILEELRERVRETQDALEQAKAISAKAQAKQTTLEEELKAYTGAFHVEERRNGVANIIKVVTPSTTTEVTSPAATGEVNKSDELKGVLKEREDGIAPTDLHEELQKKGVNIGLNYVYALLFKLRRAGAVRKKGRKFYWIESQETKTASE